MNYSLVKKLKDAGFPQELADPSSYFSGANLFSWSEGEDKPYGEYVKCPTLSELIEACEEYIPDSFCAGSQFLGLNKEPNPKGEPPWTATQRNLDASGSSYVEGKGSTPEEAVALLYISLQKDKNGRFIANKK